MAKASFFFFLHCCCCWYCQRWLTPSSWHFSRQQSDALRMRQENTHVRFGIVGSRNGPYATFSLSPPPFSFFYGVNFSQNGKYQWKSENLTRCWNRKNSGKSRRIGRYCPSYGEVRAFCSLKIPKQSLNPKRTYINYHGHAEITRNKWAWLAEKKKKKKPSQVACFLKNLKY